MRRRFAALLFCAAISRAQIRFREVAGERGL
jgi:hypothetical protein